MANLNFAYSSAPVRTIKEIQFGLFSAKESERLSVIDIEYPGRFSPQTLSPERVVAKFLT
jgi:DNA-directed RNA polymerase II subunit RPB1